MKGRFANLFSGFFDSEKVAGLLLLICTIVSVSLANSASGEGYVHFMHSQINLSFANINLDYSIEHWVNDGLMAIFFLMVGLEVERELYIGELADIKRALLPVVAAVGGMIFPSLIHFIFNAGTPTQSGFAIPMATDIAFALGILALAGNKVPVAVKVFLTALAIIDDVGAILVIAFFYTKTVLFAYLIGALAIFAMLLVFNRLRIKNLLFYLLPGIVMWYCFLHSGVHATISGVLLAFAIPFHEEDLENVSYKLQNFLHKPVAFIIVPIFALVNTAIVIPTNFIDRLSSSNALGIIIGLYAGKLIGIFTLPFIFVKAGWAQLQRDISWSKLIGIGCLGGIGFTMSMFISNLAFTDAEIIVTSKLSVLVASSAAALSGYLIFAFSKPIPIVPDETNIE